MKIISNPYAVMADISEAAAITTEKGLEVYEEMLDEQIELYHRGRDSRFEIAKAEQDIDLAKARQKLNKLKAKYIVEETKAEDTKVA